MKVEDGTEDLELKKEAFFAFFFFFLSPLQVAELVKMLRWELDQLLEDKIRSPSMDLCTCPRGSRIIHMIVHLISTQ